MNIKRIVDDNKDKKQKLLANAAPPISDNDIHNIDNNAGNINNNTTNSETKKYKKRTCCWFFCGFILAVFVIQLTFIPHLITTAIRNSLTDAFVFTKPDPHNTHYQQWITNDPTGSDVPIIFSIQFFNVTNPDQVLEGAAPNLTLVGPLVYNQYFYRRDINFSDDGEWVNHTFFTEYLLSLIHYNYTLHIESA